jgi:hypothetical protein
MENMEKILELTSSLSRLYGEIDCLQKKIDKNHDLIDDKIETLLSLVEEPICHKLYFGDYGLYVAWGKDEVNVPQLLVFENNRYFPVNNFNITPDIYGIGIGKSDVIYEYKLTYLEEKFDFVKEY